MCKLRGELDRQLDVRLIALFCQRHKQSDTSSSKPSYCIIHEPKNPRPYEGLPGSDVSADKAPGRAWEALRTASRHRWLLIVICAQGFQRKRCQLFDRSMPTFGPGSFFAAVWALTSVLPWSCVQRDPFPNVPLVECHCHCEFSGLAPSACPEVPSSSTGWASSVVGGLVAAAGGVGFISGLFVAGGFWGAVQCFRQVLLSWWGPSPDPHHAATQALRDREVRGAVPRAQWS